MKHILRENEGLPASVLWTLAIVGGVTVANLYYNQPLLNMIRQDLGVSEFTANLIAMATQVGYAVGLLFIVPMGDLYQRRKIILVNFGALIFSLLTIALSGSVHVILAASFITGLCSVMPQIFIPIASQFSLPANKARNVGLLLSGLLTGVLASRVVGGFVGRLMGWREMYFVAAALMVLCLFVTLKVLPEMRPNFNGKYSELMRSLFSLVRQYPRLRVYSLRAALCFGSMLGMWACLAFKMGQAPFFAGSDVIGMLGLCGIAGALTASVAGFYIKRVGVRRFNFLGCGLLLLAWALFYFGEESFVSIVAGVIVIDIGMQCVQLSNQSSVFEMCPGASSRVNTIFMTTYFVGGALGTFLTGVAWQLYGWHGVVGVGATLAFLSLLITYLYKK
ncbi:MAG: MFS transporter [Mediterranea sp.]|jgi:predicted MFS family arabinose efflux permease|nr:MFS transporter [Mediterranea sp.]